MKGMNLLKQELKESWEAEQNIDQRQCFEETKNEARIDPRSCEDTSNGFEAKNKINY